MAHKGVLLGQQTAKRLVRQSGFSENVYDPSGVKSGYAGDSGGTGLAKSPVGGIPARSGITVGVATCNLAELYDDSGTIKIREKSPAQPAVIYNTTIVAVSASKWIHWKMDGIYRIVDVDDCA